MCGAVKALAILCVCADSFEPLLLANAIENAIT